MHSEDKDIRAFAALGFDGWLGYNIKEATVESTVQFAAEFVTFCRKKCSTYSGFVICVLYYTNVYTMLPHCYLSTLYTQEKCFKCHFWCFDEASGPDREVQHFSA
jgi:hypothetical protein